VKRLPDGRALLNLGSSARVSPDWNNLDFSWLIPLARHPRLSLLLNRAKFLSDVRYERTKTLDKTAIDWDLRRGISISG
jgi:hypothetical protein